VTKATQKTGNYVKFFKIIAVSVILNYAKNPPISPNVSLTGWDFRAGSPPRRVGNVAAPKIPMKKDIHPKYNPVVFVDMTTGKRFISRSTKTSDKKEVIDGVEHSLISIGITSDSHPFFTGQKQFVDTEGRIDKFQKRFGTVRRVGKPKLD
jgi:large subunit ribosomal protein L31